MKYTTARTEATEDEWQRYLSGKDEDQRRAIGSDEGIQESVEAQDYITAMEKAEALTNGNYDIHYPPPVRRLREMLGLR